MAKLQGQWLKFVVRECRLCALGLCGCRVCNLPATWNNAVTTDPDILQPELHGESHAA